MEGIILKKTEAKELFNHLTKKMVMAPHFDAMDRIFMTNFEFFEGAHYSIENKFIMIYYVRGLKVPYLMDDDDIDMIKRYGSDE